MNHFVAGRKGDLFIQLGRNTFLYVWKDGIDFASITHEPLISFAKDIMNSITLLKPNFHIYL